MQRLHQTGFFQGREISSRLTGNFCNLLFLRKSLFFSSRGTAHPVLASEQALVLPRNGWRFLLFSKGMRPPTCFFRLGFAVTAADRSLHPVSGASNEQLVASAHGEEEAAILRTSSFVQMGWGLIFPATVKGSFKNKQNTSPKYGFLLGGKKKRREADLFNKEGENRLREHVVLHINKVGLSTRKNPQPGQWTPVCKHAEQHWRDQKATEEQNCCENFVYALIWITAGRSKMPKWLP